jgi:hypothetical protein
MWKRKSVSFERMQEILSKHAPKAGDEVKASEAPVPGPVIKQGSSPVKRMKWRKRKVKKTVEVEGELVESLVEDEHTIESDGGYAVMMCTTDGVPTDPPRFIAFHIGGEVRTVLGKGGYNTGEEARAACEAHRAEQMEASAA